MSATNEPKFDWKQAASLLGDDPKAVPEDMAAITLELIESADAQFKELKGLNAATDRKTISSLSHQLRGCLLNFGFTAVGALLLHIEHGTYGPDEFPGLVDKALGVFITSKNMLAARYPSIGLA